MNSCIEKLVKDAFEGSILQINTKQITITFDDDTSIILPMCILIWNIPLFDKMLKSNLKEAQEYVIHLKNCDKKTFENCLTIAINNDNIFFQEIKKRLEDDISINEFLSIMETLKIYYNKFEYLGIMKGCELIEQIILSNDLTLETLRKLEDANNFFLVDKEDKEDKDKDKDPSKNNDYLILLKKMEILTNSKIKNHKIDKSLFKNINTLIKSSIMTKQQAEQIRVLLMTTLNRYIAYQEYSEEIRWQIMQSYNLCTDYYLKSSLIFYSSIYYIDGKNE